MKRADIKVGFACNNNCLFCAQAHKRKYGDKSTRTIMKELRLARSTACDSVVFTGGEPTLRKDLAELVGYAKSIGFDSVQIQTNGRMLSSKAYCQQLISAGADEFCMALHGNAALHDSLTRAPGSFSQTVKGISNLKALGQRVLTNTVVVKQNYRSLPGLARLFARLKVNQFQFAFVHAVGNARTNYASVVPRVSRAAPYIKQGLQIGIDAKIKVMAEAMPLCTMKGYESYCSESFIPDTEIRDAGSYDSDFSRTRREKGKIKFAFCRRCMHNACCEGPWKEYPSRMGASEFKPVRK